MERAIARSVCFTRYLVEKDCLTAAMTRVGSGFHPPSVLYEVKDHLANVQTLVKQMELIAQTPKGHLVQMEKSCCGRD
jgi:hypothetical protein